MVRQHRKTGSIRRLLLGLALAVMLGSGAGYLYEYRNFTVDDTQFESEIREAARKYGIDSRLVRSVVYEESRFRPGAVGKAGEIGLMQIMPDHAGVDWARANGVPRPEPGVLFSPRINLEIGCWYLSDGLRRFRDYDHAAELALARYNAGLSRANVWKPADKAGEVIPNIKIESTRQYVKNIMSRYRRYCEETALNENSVLEGF